SARRFSATLASFWNAPVRIKRSTVMLPRAMRILQKKKARRSEPLGCCAGVGLGLLPLFQELQHPLALFTGFLALSGECGNQQDEPTDHGPSDHQVHPANDAPALAPA